VTRKRTAALLLSSAAAALAAVSLAVTPRAARAHTIAEVAGANRSFSTLSAAVRAAGLADTLRGAGPYTVFAPTDAAFAKLPKGTLEALLRPENRGTLAKILTYHVVPGEVLQANVVRLKDGAKVATVNGARLTVRNDLQIRVDGANVIRTDILTDNGVIHAIDSVLLPPGLDLPSLNAPSAAAASADIVDTAAQAGQFKTLLAAVKAAGLTDTLRGDGPFTVFAPTDEAFAKLPQGTLAALLRPENKGKLTAILTYHVLAGRRVDSARIARLRGSVATARTVNGAELRVRSGGGSHDGSGIRVPAAALTTAPASGWTTPVSSRPTCPRATASSTSSTRS
jgi:uncharacterized surface protein with fasciclin (FAS1) repeats